MGATRPARKRATFREAFRYWFDNQMGKGSVTLILWLFFFAAAVIFFLSLLLLLLSRNGAHPASSWWSMVWTTFMHALDTGAIGGDSGHPGFVLIMMGATLCGMFLLGTLIGIINAGIDKKLEQLRRGRSRVLEHGHTIILGWSEHVFTLIEELVEANRSERRPCIAVLAEKDKVGMEEEIRKRLPDHGNTRIVCRSGSPVDRHDLDIVSPGSAKSIIIPSPPGAMQDVETIKMLLAIANTARLETKRAPEEAPGSAADDAPVRRTKPGKPAMPWIVASLADDGNREVASLAAKGNAFFVNSEELIARIMAHACRQAGLSLAYSELLDFEGSEIYFTQPLETDAPSLIGRSFGDALLCYDSAMIIGAYNIDTGGVRINPPHDTILTKDDHLILIAEDDSTIRYTDRCPFDEEIVRAVVEKPVPAETERYLFLQWNGKGARILQELDGFVPPGTIALALVTSEAQALRVTETTRTLTRIGLETRVLDPVNRTLLASVHPESFSHIIVLSPEDVPGIQQADAKTLSILLLLRATLRDGQGHHTTVISEMQDVRNRVLAEAAHPDDFIVSSRINSLHMAQLSENPELDRVFEDLFNAGGSELYLKPMELYFRDTVTLSFATLIRACSTLGHIAIGYRDMRERYNPAENYGVYINSMRSSGDGSGKRGASRGKTAAFSKNDTITLRPGDQIIVISEM